MNNADLYERAKKVLPGGVCSSVRLNQGLGHPVYLAKTEGARMIGVDGREYIDMCCGHGSILLGHGHPAVRQALVKAAELGICCSADMPYHVELAERLCGLIPCAEQVRFTNSGTEATLHALRLCRAVSGRDKVIRFVGHFHGYHEYVYIGGRPPRELLDRASDYRESAGIPEPMSRFIIAVPFNDIDAAAEAITSCRDEAGTVILEPVNFNCGGIAPQPGYLEELRRLTRENDMLLFFDEVLTSFKKSAGGAQQDFGVTPDICTIGKAVGGGLPLSAICGPTEIMSRYTPTGDVTHSGTFNAPLPSMLGGLAFCGEIEKPAFYPELLKKADRFYQGIDDLVGRLGVPVRTPRHGSRFGMLMGLEKDPVQYRDTFAHRRDLMLAFIRGAAERGVYFHDYGGGPAHHGISAAHTDADLDQVLDVMEKTLAGIKDQFASGASGAQ